VCGIAGKVYTDRSRPVDPRLVQRMLDTIRHRGPDDEGLWVNGHVGLGSRRLAIIDLSPRARQPMTNDDGSLHLVFNGEIYNFQALRADLERRGHRFRSDSDTETILRLYEDEGIKCLDRLWGMFALALWDARDGSLIVARDRLGKKPLFYHFNGEHLVFGSEPKTILQDPDVTAEADPSAIDHYLTYGYVPSPLSAFRGLRKLPPAHYLRLHEGALSVERYWTLRYSPKREEREDHLIEELGALLREAVRLRLIADVPVGALLSGGLDSSTVVALMRQVTSGRITTFSIGFEDADYDELRYAREVARRFDTDHHELVVRPNAVELLPRLVWHYNEPFADSSAVPSYAVCQMARRLVTVALNGDGGDESFLGYDRYQAARLGRLADALPRPLLAGVVHGASWLPHTDPKSRVHALRRFVEALGLERARRYARWMVVFDEETRRALCTPAFQSAVAGGTPLARLDALFASADGDGDAEAAASADVHLYLPDDLLVKMDIASMANSLELRSPFLDHRVVEFAAALPSRMKLRGTTQKYLVKALMRGVLPESILGRAKMGFAVPIDRWLRQELRQMTHDVLLDSRARQRGYFDPEGVRKLLEAHEAGQPRHRQLWALLMLELWHRTFIDQPCPVGPPDTCGV